MMTRDSDKKETDTNTKKSGTTVAGQLLSFLGGGVAGSIAYNAYHSLKDTSQKSSAPKPKM